MEDVEIKKYPLKLKFNFFSKLFSALFLFYAIYSAYIHRWVTDDAFISFRYARNLSRGLGFVFNQGEFVEGYTNFLWTILIYFGLKLNLDPIFVSIYLGIIFYIFSLIILYKISFQLNQRNFFPLAFFCFSIQAHAHIFATSGLEGSMFGFFLLSGLGIFIFQERISFLSLGNFFLILACLTRPDGFLFYIIANLFLLIKLISKKEKFFIFKIFIMQTPFLLFYIPYFYWKFHYYGSIFPNTFYAKSGDKTYFEQGFLYIKLYFLSYYGFLISGIVFLVWAFKFKKMNSSLGSFISSDRTSRLKEKNLKKLSLSKLKRRKKTPNLKKISKSAFWILFLPSLLYIFYLCKIGGDFMFARLLIPISPILFLFTEIILSEQKKYSRILYSIILILSFLFYYNPYKNTQIPIIDQISNESDIYKLNSVYELKLKLIPISKEFRDEEIPVAFGGSEAMLIYYLDPKIAIESVTGLTDEFIAHQEIKTRGRVGHEKQAPLDYLKKRKVGIHFFPSSEIPKKEYNLFKIKNFPGEFRILEYDSASFENLGKTKNFSFTNFESYLDKYNFSDKSKDTILKDYTQFKEYYFNSNEDFLREEKFKKFLD